MGLCKGTRRGLQKARKAELFLSSPMPAAASTTLVVVVVVEDLLTLKSAWGGGQPPQPILWACLFTHNFGSSPMDPLVEF